MRMPFWQKAYDFFDRLQSPKWYVDLTNQMQAALIVALKQVGKENLASLRDKAVEVYGKDISDSQKISEVYTFAKSLLPKLGDLALHALIGSILSALKNKE